MIHSNLYNLFNLKNFALFDLIQFRTHPYPDLYPSHHQNQHL